MLKKNQTGIDQDIEEKILSMYAKGMSTGDIEAHIQDICGIEVSDTTVIGHTGDLLVDIYTAKYDAYLHFTAVLNDGGKGAQFRRNGCSI